MPQETTTYASRSAPVARDEGNHERAGAQGEKASGPVLLTKESVLAIGEAIGSRIHWQASIARRIGVSKSQVTRYLNGERATNTMLGDALLDLMLQNLQELGDLLDTPGLPNADDPITAEVKSMITRAVKMARTGERPDN